MSQNKTFEAIGVGLAKVSCVKIGHAILNSNCLCTHSILVKTVFNYWHPYVQSIPKCKTVYIAFHSSIPYIGKLSKLVSRTTPQHMLQENMVYGQIGHVPSYFLKTSKVKQLPGAVGALTTSACCTSYYRFINILYETVGHISYCFKMAEEKWGFSNFSPSRNVQRQFEFG